MGKDFDFDEIGKREPYVVPEGFFVNLQEKIERETISKRKHRVISWRAVITGAASLAATIAIVLTVGLSLSDTGSNGHSIEDVEECFSRLCEADQQFLLETYQEDVFLND